MVLLLISAIISFLIIEMIGLDPLYSAGGAIAYMILFFVLFIIFSMIQGSIQSKEDDKAFSIGKKPVLNLMSNLKNESIKIDNFENLFVKYIIPEDIFNHEGLKHTSSKYVKIENLLNDYLKNLDILFNDDVFLNYIYQEQNLKKVFDYIDSIKNPAFRYDYLTFLETHSMKYFDDSASKVSLKEYNFVEITRSTNNLVDVGTYIYDFDKSLNLLLLKSPVLLKTFSNKEGMHYSRNIDNEKTFYFFKSFHVNERIIIHENKIKDFQLFGTEVVFTETDIKDNNISYGDIFLTELLFGTSYSLLKGLALTRPSLKSTIKDTRIIQMILEDTTDIEFTGINIYYDLNRKYGVAHNKDKKTENVSAENQIEDKKDKSSFAKLENLNDNPTRKERLIEVKELYELDFISNEEYERMRKEILGL